MRELIFVGLGLNDETGISIRGLEATRSADSVFMELYTSLLPDFSLKKFEALAGKKATLLSRHSLEEENGETVLRAAETGRTVFLVPGDPFVATTHSALRVEADARGITTKIIHGASAMSAVVGLSGLHNYKFGKTVTVPFPDNSSETPYNVIAQNKTLGLHTLCLLDLKADEQRFLSINEGLRILLEIESHKKQGAVTLETLCVGAARVGSTYPTLKAGWAKEMLNYDFGGPPQTLIFPGELHFTEVEALIRFAGAPAKLRGMIK